jgi:Tfp pilus assembly protein PilN
MTGTAQSTSAGAPARAGVFGIGRRPATGAAVQAKPERTVRPTKNVPGVTPGREPRVDLLPVEVHLDRRGRAIARRMWFGAGLVAALVVLGTAAATIQSMGARSDLAAAQGETASIQQQQQQYGEVRRVEQDTALARAGQEVGGSTEIDWQSTLGQVQQLLPDGVVITALSIDSSSPVQTFDQSTAPLQGSRVATLNVTVSSPSIPSVPDWTDRLEKLTGYVDSNIDSITRGTVGGDAASSTSGAYQASITLHLDGKAYDGKYAEKSK